MPGAKKCWQYWSFEDIVPGEGEEGPILLSLAINHTSPFWVSSFWCQGGVPRTVHSSLHGESSQQPLKDVVCLIILYMFGDSTIGDSPRREG